MVEITMKAATSSAVRKAVDATLSLASVQAMLDGVGRIGGPAGLRLDARGTCHFRDGDGRPVSILYAERFPGLTMIAAMLEVFDPPRALELRLLEANANWRMTRGGVFAVQGAQRQITYSRRTLLPEPTAETCLRAICAFVDVAAEMDAEMQLFCDALLMEEQTLMVGPTAVGMMV